MAYWPADLLQREREVCDAPPFAKGDTIIDRDHPERGSQIVTACEPYQRGGGWRVEFGVNRTAGGSWGCAPADRFVLAPPGWVEPPTYPYSLEYIDLPSSLPRPSPAERVDALLALADWWEWVGAEVVAPTIAATHAASLRLLAADVVGEG